MVAASTSRYTMERLALSDGITIQGHGCFFLLFRAQFVPVAQVLPNQCSRQRATLPDGGPPAEGRVRGPNTSTSKFAFSPTTLCAPRHRSGAQTTKFRFSARCRRTRFGGLGPADLPDPSKAGFLSGRSAGGGRIPGAVVSVWRRGGRRSRARRSSGRHGRDSNSRCHAVIRACIVPYPAALIGRRHRNRDVRGAHSEGDTLRGEGHSRRASIALEGGGLVDSRIGFIARAPDPPPLGETGRPVAASMADCRAW